MSALAGAPLIFLDVDGPLIPFGSGPDGRPGPRTAAVPSTGRRDGGRNPLLRRLDAGDGPRLLALGGDLVWATTWMTTANDLICPRIGLPELPVVDFSQRDYEPHPGLHWKTQGLITWAAGRPFVWIDDEISDADRGWVRAHHDGVALLHRVEPSTGLTDADFAAVAAWLGGRGTAGG